MILYSRYSDFLAGDTLSVTAGTEDPVYPKENITDILSRTVGKFTGSSGTYRRTFGASKTPAAAFFLNTNATAITLSNNNGLSIGATVPAVPEDGLTLDFGIDLRNVGASGTATQWNAAISGAAGVGLGEFMLVTNLRTFYGLWQPAPVEDEGHPVSHGETSYEVDLDYGMGIRVRRGALTVRDEDGRATLLSLERAQRGRLRPFILLPNADFTDVMLVKFATDSMRLVTIGGSPTVANAYVLDMALEVKEMQKGLAY